MADEYVIYDDYTGKYVAAADSGYTYTYDAIYAEKFADPVDAASHACRRQRVLSMKEVRE